MEAAMASVNKLETAFDTARAYYGTKADKDAYLLQLDELEKFMEAEGYDAEMEDDDLAALKKDFLVEQEEARQAKVVMNRIIKLLVQQRGHSQLGLLKAPMLRKYELFRETVNMTVPEGDLSDAVELALSSSSGQFRGLFDLEKVAAANRLPFTEQLVTWYHESGLPLHEFAVQCPLLRQCRDSGKVALYEQLRRYLEHYEHSVCRPLPRSVEQEIGMTKYSDNINIVLNYVVEVNEALHKMVQRRAFPLQLDVFFVAPGSHQNLNLDHLRGLDSEYKSDTISRRNGAIDGTSDVYRLLRAAAIEMNASHRQRFVLLVVRHNLDDAVNDTLYVFRPDVARSIADEHVSDYVELSYLKNSKTPVVDGLPSNTEGVLGLCHHLHAHDCAKVYLSYGGHKSRVFKNHFLDRLKCVVNGRNQQRHCIDSNTKTEFSNSYLDFADARCADIGRYWFGLEDAYDCWEPSWNPENCRAMGNVFISKECTQRLISCIDEQYASTETLYYRMDYTVGMQIVDRETVHFKKLKDGALSFTVIHMDLHRGGEALYAVIVPNPHKSKQKWKVNDCGKDEDGQLQIGDAFMTKAEVCAKYNIFERDLPRGSRTKHSNFEEELARIVVDKKLIKATKWSHIRIVQSKQNCAKSGMVSGRKGKRKSNKNAARTVLGNKICSRRFERLCLDSLAAGTELTPIVHFKFRKNEYNVEKLLPVRIPGEGLVAVSFTYNVNNKKVQASGVCLDLIDIRNKANLIRTKVDESWLRGDDDTTINNLAIEDCEKSCDHRGKGAAPKCKNQRKKQPKRSAVKAPRHIRATGGSPKCKTPSPPPSVKSSASSETSVDSRSTVSSPHSVRSMHSQRAHTAPARTTPIVHTAPRVQKPVMNTPMMVQQQQQQMNVQGWAQQQQMMAQQQRMMQSNGYNMNGNMMDPRQQQMYRGHYQQPQQQQYVAHPRWYQPTQSGFF